MAESKSTAATTDHVKGKDINGQMVTLERTQPRQLSLFQTFLPDEERYSNTIDLYDALPKYFSNHTIMRSLRKSGQYLPVLKREFEHKGTMYVLQVRPARIVYANGEEMEYYPTHREELVEEALRKIAHIPPNLVVRSFRRALIPSRGQDLQVEHPVGCGYSSTLYFHPIAPRMQRAPLLRNQDAQMR